MSKVWDRSEASPRPLLAKLAEFVASLTATIGTPLFAKAGAHLEPAPVGEARVRAAILEAALVDVKIVAYSATHTALKAVIPVALRASR